MPMCRSCLGFLLTAPERAIGPQFSYHPRSDVRLSEQPRTGRAPQVAKRPYRSRRAVELPNAALPVRDIGIAKNKDIDRRLIRKVVHLRVRTVLFLEFRAKPFQGLVTHSNLAYATAT